MSQGLCPLYLAVERTMVPRIDRDPGSQKTSSKAVVHVDKFIESEAQDFGFSWVKSLNTLCTNRGSLR